MNNNLQKILREIQEKASKIGKPLRFMQLCGTHSQVIAENNLKSLIADNIKLISGPGCPVCVTDQSDIDAVIGLALNGVPIAVYGDVVNIPGSTISLEQARQRRADIQVVYDVQEAIKLKKRKPKLIFFGIGFETTTPMTAWAIKRGLVVYSAHKLFPPAMRFLLENRENKIDGFINPGHVSAIVGTKTYREFKIPQVIAGFESVDVLSAVNMLLDQIIRKEARVENEYIRLVSENGNYTARKIIAEVFEISDANWRGLGLIKKSGLRIRKKYQKQDAKFVYKNLIKKTIYQSTKENRSKFGACKCGSILQGLIEPKDCPLFDKVCSPENPQGACMVSIEGSCNIDYRYNKHSLKSQNKNAK